MMAWLSARAAKTMVRCASIGSRLWYRSDGPQSLLAIVVA